MDNKQPLLSICIPTYNRADTVVKQVLDILSLQLQEIEVVILDNCSSDGTLRALNEINDKRLSVYSHHRNIGSILNIFKSLQLARGEYSLLCLDKDRINVDYLEDFIRVLKENKNVVFGFCRLEVVEKKDPVYFHAGLDAIMNLAYLSKHPSGNFYKTEKYKKSNILNEILNERFFTFCEELLNAELACCGDGMIVNIPLIIPEYARKGEIAKIKSYTYNSDNCYFFPNHRASEYGRYISHLSTLPLSKKEKKIAIRKLFARGLYSCTIEFKNTLKNEDALQHYHIKPQKRYFYNYVYYAYYFYKSFFDLDIYMNRFDKFVFMLEVHPFYAVKLIKKIIRKLNPLK